MGLLWELIKTVFLSFSPIERGEKTIKVTSWLSRQLPYNLYHYRIFLKKGQKNHEIQRQNEKSPVLHDGRS